MNETIEKKQAQKEEENKAMAESWGSTKFGDKAEKDDSNKST